MITNMDVEMNINITPTSQKESPLIKLREETKALEGAHKACRDINTRVERSLNIGILLCSAIVTCLETTIDSIKYNHEKIHIVKIALSGCVTFLAGVQTMFQNAQKSEQHHNVSRQYLNLIHKIDTCIRNNVDDANEYDTLHDEFSKIRTNSLSIFWFIRKSYGIK